MQIEHVRRRDGIVIRCIVSEIQYHRIRALPWNPKDPNAIIGLKRILSPDEMQQFIDAVQIDHVDVQWTALLEDA